MSTRLLLGIAAGGAVGAVLRYWIAAAVQSAVGRGFPYGTLTVNVTGSLAMGVLFVLFTERMNVAVETRAVVLIGLLGAFTTFSSFSLETLNLIEAGQGLRAGLNVAASVVLCLAAAWIGIIVGRQL